MRLFGIDLGIANVKELRKIVIRWSGCEGALSFKKVLLR